MVPRQGDRAGGQLVDRTGSRDHPAIAQGSGPVEGQYPAVGHVTRAQCAAGAPVADLQDAALDRGQTAEAVRPGPGHRVSSLLCHRARAGNLTQQRGRVGAVEHHRRVVENIPCHPTRRTTGTQLERALRNRGRGLGAVGCQNQRPSASLG